LQAGISRWRDDVVMSHHYPGPALAFPNGDARLNVTDLYVFPKADDTSKSILILNVHPSVGLNPKGPTTMEPFSTDALYEVMIDTDGDVIADIAYSFRFSNPTTGAQTATARRIEGQSVERTGDEGVVILEGALVSMGSEALISHAGDYRFFAGWRSDPFFFDTMGALNNLTFTGHDFFIDKNVCSVVLEVPNSQLGSERVNLWARTLDGSSGTWVQADRAAHASQEPFLAGDAQCAYLSAQPVDDAQFIAVFAHSLEHTGGYMPQEATRAAATLLPDVQPYQPGFPASYPTNGRALTDDAASHFLAVMSNGKVTGDGLGPHSDLLPQFPYLGAPHA
jgi:hypothetical protein